MNQFLSTHQEFYHPTTTGTLLPVHQQAITATVNSSAIKQAYPFSQPQGKNDTALPIIHFKKLKLQPMLKNYLLKAAVQCLLFLLVLSPSWAQTKSIHGKVTDSKDGSGVENVSVLVKDSKTGTRTNNDGSFQVNVPALPVTLVISSVGFASQEIKVSSTDAVSISLTGANNTLTDVVVIGYGTARKKDLTGAVSSISAKDLNQGPITNPLQQIAGKASGVSVTQTGSEPGTGPGIRIRGITSLIGGNDPLVVVDGIQGNMDLLRQVPPNEIESVDILKDASATAIYGSRGAPGVVIITTKKTKAGKVSIDYTTSASWDKIPKKLEVLNATQWWEQAQKYNVPASANHGSSTDWFNILTQDGYTQNHSLALGGGANGFNYRASVSAILQKGVVLNSNFKNYIGRIQATQKALDDKLTLTMNLNSSITNTLGSPNSVGRAAFTSNLISNSYVTRPTDPVYNADGTYFTDASVFQYINPYAVSQTVVNKGETNNLFGSLRADLQLVKGLTAGWFGSWRKVDANWGYYLPALSTVTYAIDNKGVANVSNNRQNERLMDISLNYKKNIGNHYVDAVAVYEWQNQTYQGNFAQAKGFINDIATYNALQLGDLSKVLPGDMSSYKNDRTIVSFLGRINYAYANKYLLTLSMRRDGSSVFGANHKWGNFPSASIAWKLTEEGFMKGQKTFSTLKIRAGYGVTGNQQGLGPQNSLQLVGASGIAYFAGNPITNFVITQNANADLRWETKNQTNVGIDFGFLENKLTGTIEAYTSTTKNLLFNYSVPQPPYPYGTIIANVGSLSNKGLELSLNYKLINRKDMSFILAGNVSLMKNKVLELSGSINGVPLNTDYIPWGPNSYLIKGQPIGTFNIIEHLGKDATNSETVVDQNKDNIIDQGNRSPDRVIKGSALPTYTFTVSPVFTYKHWDISMLWRGSGGNKVYNNLRSSLSLFESLGKGNVFTSAIPLGLYTSKYGSDLWLEDGSFIRFENLTLGYNFDLKNLKYIAGLRVSATGNNLALITQYKGLDPELNVSGGNGFGGDGGIYPRTRSIAIGLNVIFK
jgi:iron complex outermembrane receptor protein